MERAATGTGGPGATVAPDAPLVAIDLRMLHASGIGTYLRSLVPRVLAARPATRFCLLGRTDEMLEYDWAHSGNVTPLDCRAPVYSVAEQLEVFRKIPRNTNLFWSPHYNIPLLYRGKLLVTVHDVFHLAMPQYVEGLHRRLYARGMFAALRRRADAILTVSGFTKQELVRLTGGSGRSIHPVYNGVDPAWFHVPPGPRPYPRPFILYVGNVKPHKNLANLVRAFGLIRDGITQDLLIVGKREGFITGDETAVGEAAVLEARVRFTGYVEEDLLRQYLAHADALVLPSLYEGFGLPPLEAMACGCPVIVSHAASLPEVCGNAALYCDPHSPQDIADKIQRLMGTASLRQELRARGRKHARRFTWDRCAEQTVETIERVLRS